ncbi:hypothetical protein SUGI_0695100 [Cryptomeria japonica]|nr:hypothetical protein SUGI_0695100 [Cryptomeria japonica]
MMTSPAGRRKIDIFFILPFVLKGFTQLFLRDLATHGTTKQYWAEQIHESHQGGLTTYVQPGEIPFRE